MFHAESQDKLHIPSARKFVRQDEETSRQVEAGKGLNQRMFVDDACVAMISGNQIDKQMGCTCCAPCVRGHSTC